MEEDCLLILERRRVANTRVIDQLDYPRFAATLNNILKIYGNNGRRPWYSVNRPTL